MEEDNISLEQHSKKDKFHLLRVPHGFDIQQLNGVEYDPHQILEIQVTKDVNGLLNVYELGTFAGQKMDLNLLVKSEDKVQIGPALRDNLSITKTVRLDSTEQHFAVKAYQTLPSGHVGLPEGLKERFSPFGCSHIVSPTKKGSPKKSKKRKRSLDDSSSPTIKRQKPGTDDNDNEYDAQIVFNHTVNDRGDAGVISTPSVERVKKHKKKKHKSYKGESEMMNGVISPSKIKKEKKSAVISSDGDCDKKYVNSCDDYIPLSEKSSGSEEIKTHKKKKKHSLRYDTMPNSSLNESVHQISNEVVVKEEKRHKGKIKKEKEEIAG